MSDGKIKKRSKGDVWAVAVALTALFVAALGIMILISSFFVARDLLIEEQTNHLEDLAKSADRNIASVLNRFRDELEYVIADETEYYENRDTFGMLEHINALPLLKTGYISRVLVIRDDETMISVGPGEDAYSADHFYFPLGRILDKPTPCIENATGEGFLAIIHESELSKLQYAALIDLTELNRRVAGDMGAEDYWLTMLEPSSGTLLQNDSTYPELQTYSPEEALARDDGISALARSEIGGTFLTQRYVFEDHDRNLDCLIVAIPSTLSTNGAFAVGAASEIGLASTPLNNLYFIVAAACALILLGVILFVTYGLRNRRKKNEMHREVELLKEKNEQTTRLLETTQQLVHHQRLEVIGTMTSGIAHEFNNMLTPIMAYSILTMEKLPEGNDELMDNLGEIYDASRRAKSLISRMSALARKTDEAEFKLISPNGLLRKCAEMMRPSIPKDVVLDLRCRCEEECLHANETQLGQLLLNLGVNAYQAMDEGGVLTMSADAEGDRVVFRVRDTGRGIPKDELEDIFKPFYTTKEVGKGTGLGLPIAAQIAESHNGTISVESEPGKGTCFTVSLPLSMGG